MSRRNKLQKFAEVRSFKNVYQNFDTKEAQPLLEGVNGKVDLKGNWQALHFQNDFPITLELACGRGEYSLDLARRYPQRNFIGVDVKGARIWKGASIALTEGLSTVAFLRTKIEFINPFFEKEEVDEIWITFPDPFLRESKVRRRLTAPNFLERYRLFLKPGGVVHLKTDDPTLYNFTIDTLEADPQVTILYQNNDIYAQPLLFEELTTKTYYEKKHLANGKQIKYVRFTIH